MFWFNVSYFADEFSEKVAVASQWDPFQAYVWRARKQHQTWHYGGYAGLWRAEEEWGL